MATKKNANLRHQSLPSDKELVWCWDFNMTHGREVRFFDAKYKGTFTLDGQRIGKRFDFYEVIPKDKWPEWALNQLGSLND